MTPIYVARIAHLSKDVEALNLAMEGATSILQDIAITTGATYVAQEAGVSLETVCPEMLGTCERMVIGKEETTIVTDGKQAEAMEKRIQQIRTEAENTDSQFDKEKAEERVAALSGELAGITDQLDEAKGAMADRGNSMTDTSPLVKIKQALKAIRQECVDFDLQIGVAGHALMQQKLKRGAPTKDEPAAKAAGDFDDSDLDSV